MSTVNQLENDYLVYTNASVICERHIKNLSSFVKDADNLVIHPSADSLEDAYKILNSLNVLSEHLGIILESLRKELKR